MPAAGPSSPWQVPSGDGVNWKPFCCLSGLFHSTSQPAVAIPAEGTVPFGNSCPYDISW